LERSAALSDIEVAMSQSTVHTDSRKQTTPLVLDYNLLLRLLWLSTENIQIFCSES